MNETSALELAHDAVKRARSLGAAAVEATFSVSDRFHVETRDTAIAQLEGSIGKRLHLRLFVDQRKVALSTSDFSRDGLDDAIRRAVDQARYVGSDPFATLPDRCGSAAGDLALRDPAFDEREELANIEDAFDLERRIRAGDPRVVNSSGSNVEQTTSVVALANSEGFASAYTATRATRSTGPVAVENGVKRTAHYGTAARHLADLEPNECVAKQAVRRAVEMLGARKPSTMRVPVIFERDVAAAVLSDLFSAISAANVASGNSWLAERVGERIGSELVTIHDDGTLPGALGSAPFDGEGVATRRTTVFERGVLKTFLYDSYYARRLGAATTGNSTGGDIGPTSFYLDAGTQTLDELIARTPRGVLILDTIGFATEHASGMYSRGARGWYIEDGVLCYPIDEFTIAGEFATMLASVDALANDLRFDGSIVAPSFRVAEMMISGN